MSYSVIFAHDLSGGIGKDGGLPWYLPGDLEFFKQWTTGKNLVCGYTTYTSLPRTVKGRVLLIQSSNFFPNLDKTVMGNVTAEVLQELSNKVGDVVVIGGTSLFTEEIVLNAHSIFVTNIDREYFCDTKLCPHMMDKIRKLPYEILEHNEEKHTPTYTIRRYYAKLSKTNNEHSTDRLA